ncbi:type I methionyl aminopeptidase [Jonesia denitrificans]|uniref:Methionine aminopeptidase n=1 Tax=Jonesia denitrificans (strain ATCC 14870 / DSM 20603 / BCRC 15368 / CIP 55.134 / JCM 11481 / NBRC 15587 / NCTC 10816 / Prevot 55134) TaxID=471856 RepID=C7R2U5_JONDD|nr:type I methionyl aminopeptidase [Jonesia denitrificans]ACV08567.1 methionine aminopeptidase, type I [Jonesia denitrificans DSM 20603]ASE07809.1 type I methionyl aminopeptidase [Jonesia denitrificans]QXB42418.1 type I methionyl aminopeptidase [Jonesia denitrificans]SQH20552.1 Methionine aminopeptidase 1 [Jonesia denitrificans]
MIEKKTPEQIEKMRVVGAVVATALEEMQQAAAPGVSLKELDAVGAQVLADHGATSPFLNYHPDWAPSPFPGSICASVNDAVVHGIPTDQLIADGDVVSIDFGAVLDGWCGDAARTFIVGTPRPEDEHLIEVTRQALYAGIEAAQVGNTVGDIGHAVHALARKHRLGNLEDHGGHGIGTEMHMDPFVPNKAKKGKGTRLEEGMVICIEPMFILGGKDSYYYDDDGWTIRSIKGGRSAHWEHTIAITAQGPDILTIP